jgi:hypothetical protein
MISSIAAETSSEAQDIGRNDIIHTRSIDYGCHNSVAGCMRATTSSKTMMEVIHAKLTKCRHVDQRHNPAATAGTRQGGSKARHDTKNTAGPSMNRYDHSPN